ncbi:MAG: chemotaxis protein CheW [Verrucomicrobia bacterium]|nr:chemotaxis protein CheW [Verrucomicrobiota bacterium]
MQTRGQTLACESQLVTFTLGSEEYGVDINKVREINRLTEITHVPKAPPFVEGLINLRGTVVPIIDLRKRFDIEPAGDEKQQRIIVVDIGGRTIGVIVDSVSEVLNLSAEAIDEVPATISSGVNQRFLTGVGKIGERLMLLLDLDSILSAEELGTLGTVA